MTSVHIVLSKVLLNVCNWHSVVSGIPATTLVASPVAGLVAYAHQLKRGCNVLQLQ